MLKEITKKIRGATVEGHKLFSDLLALLAGAAVPVFVGGHLYLRAYFDRFGLSTLQFWDWTYTLTAWWVYVALDGWGWTLLMLGLFLILAFIYLLVRYVFVGWLSYFLLCMTFAGLVLVFGFVGQAKGRKDAELALKGESPRAPKVTLVAKTTLQGFDAEITQHLAASHLHLLHQDQDRLYLFLPKGTDATQDSRFWIVPKDQFGEMRLYVR